jgi:hypothetical protein
MAALDISCLDGVLGLSNCACPCLEDSAPEGYNDSLSGLYITDLVPMEMLGGTDKCTDSGSPWNTVDRARTQGANMLMKDVRSGLMKRNQSTRPYYNGMIGEQTARDVRSIANTYAGLRIWSPRNKGGKMRITRLGGIFNGDGTVEVGIYDRFNNQIGDAITITTSAGRYAYTACDITLNLWAEGADSAQYFLAYTVNQSNLPRANRLFCPTCSRKNLPVFSTLSPYTSKAAIGWTGPQGWANWVMPGRV